jgi:energy-coupling factor transport system ATP-binding protein
MSAVVEFAGFSYTPPGRDRPVLREIELSFAAGELVLVCGSSGSGKSTLLKAIAGIVPHHYGGSAAGEARIAGRDLRDHNAASLAEVCATVLQDPESQAVMGGVEAEIAFPLENAGVEPGQIALRVEQTAQSLGITGLLGRRTAELSGGELQRVVLAASLAPAPQLLVLDEPGSQLDPVATDELHALLLRLRRDNGATVVVAEHHTERLIEHADRVVVLDEGCVVFDGPPAQMLAWASHAGRTDLMPQIARAFAAGGSHELPVGPSRARELLCSVGPFAAPFAAPDEGLDGAASARSQKMVAVREGLEADDRPAAADLRGVSFAYEGSTTDAVNDVDLTFACGERVALMGANGSGKSSLMRLVKGIEEPRAGVIKCTGEVALLLQNPNDYLLHERVADEAPPRALARFGLDALAECDPRDLSGGERQRLALAIVMQSDPALLLLDEPSRGMDGLRREQLLAELREIAMAGAAVIVATHDAELAAEFADRIVLLGRGRVLADCTPGELLGGGGHLSTDAARLMPGGSVLTASDLARVLRSAGREVPA